VYVGPVGPQSGTKVTRGDVAVFMLDQLAVDAPARAIPVVTAR